MSQSNFKVIGIIGKLNSGKDTVAGVFESRGYDRRAFADPLKLFIHELFDIPREVLWGPSENRTGEVRQMLQQLGTDYARKFRPNIWVDKTAEAIELSRRSGSVGVVIPDVRFLNESAMLYHKDAILIRVVRPSSGAHESDNANAHASEMESNDIPEEWITDTIHNDGTLEDLHARVKVLLRRITP